MFDSEKIKKILILRLGAIGDVVHSTALFRSLKKYNPDLSIHYLTFETPSLLIENDPDLDKVWIAKKKSYKYLIKLANILQKENFDLFINLQPSIKTKIFSFFIKTKYILTYKKNFKYHAVENFWKTAKPVFKKLVLDNKLKIYLSDKTNEKVSNLIKTNKKIISFNIGANLTRQGRRWPIEYWVELAKKIINKYNYEIILTGSEDDIELAENLLKVSQNIKSFCGKLNIAETAILLSKCCFVISGDTGPIHIATAMNIPVIGIYGSTPFLRTGPYGKQNFVLNSNRKCVPCNKRKCKFIRKNEQYTPCLKDIMPDEIINIIDKNLFNPDF
ncbi:MAG: glycosyltransferase family 9 protein [bacterium]